MRAESFNNERSISRPSRQLSRPRRDRDETMDRSREGLETETSRSRAHPGNLVFDSLIYLEPVNRFKNKSNVMKFRSFGDSTCSKQS